MRELLIVMLLATPATAEICPGKGTPIVELEYRDETPDAYQLRVVLYANGRQTATRSGGNERSFSLPGCRSDAQMKPIKDALKAATWKVTHARITCKARSPKSTVVKIDGRVVITEEVCGADSLDATSAKRLAEIEALLPTLDYFDKCLANPLGKDCI